jgi:hypothetical protein
MALNWNLENVENYKELFTEEDEQGYVEMKQVYQQIILNTMHVGIRDITEQNWKQFYNRLYMLEKIKGAGCYSLLKLLDGTEKMQPIYTTVDDVKRMIGLHTNASTISKKEFLESLCWNLEI